VVVEAGESRLIGAAMGKEREQERAEITNKGGKKSLFYLVYYNPATI